MLVEADITDTNIDGNSISNSVLLFFIALV